MLKDATAMAMVAVKDIKKSEEFYSQTLELNKVDENTFGVTYDCGGAKMLVYPTPTAGTAKSTVVTWSVKDIKAVVDELKGKGVKFEHYDFPGATHEGDVHIMAGTKAAWFTDPDANILGLSEG